MNEMYNMSIVTHNFGVMGILGAILLNVFVLYRANNIQKYKNFMTLFMPLSSTVIGTVVFTGVIMMAAKHLDFTIENIVMIAFALALMVLEAKRSSKLKYLNPKTQDALQNYKPYGYKILQIEIVLVLLISSWMWIRGV